MKPCTASDILTKYGQCDVNTQKRKIEYSWIEPLYCNKNDAKSVKLPPNGEGSCRKCGRGSFFDKSLGKCQFCPDGFYQSKDSHKDSNATSTLGDQALYCLPCPEGKAAVKVLEYDDFEEFPSIMQKKCTVVDSTKAS